MKNVLIVFAMILMSEAMAVCSSPIARTNFSNLQVLTSTRLNTELNTVYTRANELPGDCITAESITSTQIDDGTIVNADISASAAIAMSKVAYSVAILSETQVGGTEGGASVSATWTQRVLNTEDSDIDGITTLTANQFVLQAGTYLIEGVSPAFKVGGHRSKLRNVTDSTDAIMGRNAYSAVGDGVMTDAPFEGVVTIASAKTFEVQYIAAVAQAVNGLGYAYGSSFSEVYAQVKITKIK